MILLTAYKSTNNKGFDGIVKLKPDKSIKKWLDNNKEQYQPLKTDKKDIFVILFHSEDNHLTFIHNVTDNQI